MISPAHPLKILHDEPVRWKATDRQGGEPCTASPFLKGGQEWAPLIGLGLRRLCLRAFRLEEENGKPTRSTLKQAAYMAYPLAMHWPGEEDEPPEGSCARLPGLPGWWLLHAEILPT
jgi:hypothetical protein